MSRLRKIADAEGSFGLFEGALLVRGSMTSEEADDVLVALRRMETLDDE